jgi:hypothetical protein
MATPQSTSGSVQSQFPINTLGESETPVDSEVVDTSVDTQVEDSQDSEVVDTQAQAREAEAAEEMRRVGWVDRDEWVAAGKPIASWKPASEFKSFRESLIGVVRGENSELRAKLAAMEQRERAREQREQEARERITSETLRSELKLARENSDWDKVDEITEKLLDQKVAKVAPAKPAQPALDPAVVESATRFKQANAWVETDKPLGATFALELKNIVDLRLTDNFDEALKLAKERTQRLYPEKFRSRQNGQRHAMADTGGTPGVAVGGRTLADVKEQYRRQVERDVAEKKYTVKEWLAAAAEDPNEYFKS